VKLACIYTPKSPSKCGISWAITAITVLIAASGTNDKKAVIIANRSVNACKASPTKFSQPPEPLFFQLSIHLRNLLFCNSCDGGHSGH